MTQETIKTIGIAEFKLKYECKGRNISRFFKNMYKQMPGVTIDERGRYRIPVESIPAILKLMGVTC